MRRRILPSSGRTGSSGLTSRTPAASTARTTTSDSSTSPTVRTRNWWPPRRPRTGACWRCIPARLRLSRARPRRNKGPSRSKHAARGQAFQPGMTPSGAISQAPALPTSPHSTQVRGSLSAARHARVHRLLAIPAWVPDVFLDFGRRRIQSGRYSFSPTWRHEVHEISAHWHVEPALSSCESLNGIGDWTKMGNEISKPRILRFGENPNCNLRQEIPCVADIVASRFPGFQVFVLRRRRGAHLHTHVSGAYTHRQFFMKWVFLHQDASRVSYLGPLLGCSAAAAYMVPAGASGIDAATAFPSCALSAAGRFGTVFVRAAAFPAMIRARPSGLRRRFFFA